MKIQETKTSSGGKLVEYFDDQGNRTRAVHYAGKFYSGKMVQIESREQAQSRKKARVTAA